MIAGPYHIPPRLKVHVSPCDVAVALPQPCGPCAAEPQEIELWVRRRGCEKWLARYGVWDTDEDGRLLVALDAVFFRQPFGRYEGEVRHSGCPVGSIELDYRRPRVVLGRPVAVPRVVPAFPTDPIGVTPMYRDLVTFSTQVLAPLEACDEIPLLCDDAYHVLARAVLCKPVELVLSDGCRYEIVQFSGVKLGEVILTRGQSDTRPVRFPRGATLTFMWTSTNVANAAMGC
jgi:hypothetical protein